MRKVCVCADIFFAGVTASTAFAAARFCRSRSTLRLASKKPATSTSRTAPPPTAATRATVFGRSTLLLDMLAGQKVDGAHQSSIPSPIATASEPSWPSELMPCPDPTRANGSATRTLMPISSSSCSASP